jgi:RNA polymerase sigma-70 factor (ECF subfamily)
MDALPLRPRADEAAQLAAAVRGEPAAVRWLLDDVAPTVYGFLYARVGGNQPVAEDLLQETLLEALRPGAGFRGDAALSTWLCAIARRRLARHYEVERRSEVLRSQLHAVPSHDDDLAEVEDREEVLQALGRLSALHRQVLVLKYVDGLSVEQIADELGRGRTQVQSLLQRARDGLRRELVGPDD